MRITENAYADWFFAASWTPTTFSTALPAIATTTSPAKVSLIDSESMAGCRAFTNQSETNAARDAGDREHADRQREGPAWLLVRLRLPASRWLAAQREGQRQGEEHQQQHRHDHRERRPRASSAGVCSQWVNDGIAIADTDSSMRTTIVRARSEPELLGAVLEPADHEREAEHQQQVGQDRADQSGADDVHEPRLEREDADEQLGQVAQRRLQDAGRAGARTGRRAARRTGPRARPGGDRRRPRRRRRRRSSSRRSRRTRRGRTSAAAPPSITLSERDEGGRRAVALMAHTVAIADVAGSADGVGGLDYARPEQTTRPREGRRRVHHHRGLRLLRGRRGGGQVHAVTGARRRRSSSAATPPCSPSSPATPRSARRSAGSCSTRPPVSSPTAPRCCSTPPTRPSTSTPSSCRPSSAARS